MQKQLKRGGGWVDERSESTKARIEAGDAGWWLTAPIGRCRPRTIVARRLIHELEALLDKEVTGNAERALFGLTPKPAADSSGSYGERAESGEGKIGSGVV